MNSKIKYQKRSSILFITALGMTPAYAHHAASASFDVSRNVVVEGYVNEFVFKNPHVNIIFTVTDDDGAETQWMATAPATAPMRRWGWTADTIQQGQYLRMEGHPRRDGGPMILIEGQAFRDGQEKVFEIDPADGSVIRALGMSRVETRVAESLSLTLGNGRPNLTGTWLGGPPGSTGRSSPPLNDAGRAVQATFDAATDPAFTACEDPGLVRTVMTIHAVTIEQHDDQVLIAFEGGGDGRVIYLDGRGPETAEHTRLGHAVARYENGSLVIETTQLASRLSLITGYRLSDQATTVETYRRADDPQRGPRLELELVVTDPVYLERPWTMSWQKPLAADEYEFSGVDCRAPFQANSG